LSLTRAFRELPLDTFPRFGREWRIRGLISVFWKLATRVAHILQLFFVALTPAADQKV
jgi:hypothetical protein